MYTSNSNICHAYHIYIAHHVERYNSAKVVLMVINYTWKHGHLTQVIEKIILKKDSKIEHFIADNKANRCLSPNGKTSMKELEVQRSTSKLESFITTTTNKLKNTPPYTYTTLDQNIDI